MIFHQKNIHRKIIVNENSDFFFNLGKMVRSLSQWTKTLSFPARISPNRNSKECNVNVHPITPPPAPPRKNQQSPSPPPNVPITEISQIVG